MPRVHLMQNWFALLALRPFTNESTTEFAAGSRVWPLTLVTDGLPCSDADPRRRA